MKRTVVFALVLTVTSILSVSLRLAPAQAAKTQRGLAATKTVTKNFAETTRFYGLALQKDAESELNSFLPDDDAKVLVMTYCTACHGAAETRNRIASRAGSDRTFWSNLVGRMVSTWNAPIPDEDIEPIANYLTTHFGPSAVQEGKAVPAAAGKVTVVKAGLLIDGAGGQPIQNAMVLIEGNKITRVGSQFDIPQGAVVVDASRQVVMPGLIDTHVHLGQRAVLEKSPQYQDEVREHLKQNLAFGVTTVFSLGLDHDSIYSLREKSWGGDFDGAHILTAGRGFTAPGGHPTRLRYDLPNQVDDPAQARRHVQDLAAKRVDGIKIWFANITNRPDVPQIKAEVTRAIIDEAHRQNLRVLAHINTAADTKLLVSAGLDGITHIARDSFDEETITLMKSRNVVVAPTLVQRKKALIFQEESALLDDGFVKAVFGKKAEELKQELARTKPEEFDNMRKSYEQAKQNVRRLKEAGITLAVGTDANTGFAPAGLITHKEVEAFVDAGLSPMEALVAATRGSAQWAGVSDRVGAIEAGKLADMVILERNPLADIRNTRSIVKVIIGGRVVEPLQLH